MESAKPRTPLQRKTSELNGAKSNGPRSPQGRAISCRNRLRHGMTATRLRLPDDDTHEQGERALRWVQKLDPQTDTQDQLVERVLNASYQRACCDRSFAGTITTQVQTAP